MQESQHTEFKRQWKDDLLKWISAFANAEGGVLMVGQRGGCPAPEWEIGSGGLWVTFRYSEGYVQQVLGQGGTADSASEDVNLGVKKELAFVRANQPVNAITIAAHYPQVTQRTIERWLKTLREQGKVEFKGTPKTGGYFTAEN